MYEVKPLTGFRDVKTCVLLTTHKLVYMWTQKWHL